MNHVASHLARYQPRPALTEGQLLAMFARTWHDEGIVCLRPEQLTDDFLRQAVINAADHLYGRRNGQTA